MAYQRAEINRLAAQDPKGFLEAADAKFAEKIRTTADRIADNLKHSPIVLLSGPSGSGKTTSALKIEEELDRRGIETHTISMDNYFRSIDPEDTPRTPDGGYDLESPLCMDMELLNEHFHALNEGREILIPHYDFSRQMRDTSRCTLLRPQPDEVYVFEGIHALNDQLGGQHPEAFKIYLSARSNIREEDKVVFKSTWLRLTRRCVRDMNFRGSDALTTFALWANVRRGEKLYISPFKYRANQILDTALPYEVCVMARYAPILRQALPEGSARQREMARMIDAFADFVPVDPALVAPDSLLREFIGGSQYTY
jgi:uridine kinase